MRFEPHSILKIIESCYVPVILLSARNPQVNEHGLAFKDTSSVQLGRMISNECLRACGLTAPHSCGWFYFQTTSKFAKARLVFTVMTLLSKAISEILWPGSIWQVLQDIETEYQKGTRPGSSGASLSVPKPAILEGLQISLDIRTRSSLGFFIPWVL